MESPELYWEFIERTRKEVQHPPLELHHLRSRHSWPDLEHDLQNHLTINQINHDYATLLQCWEENYPLLCPWQANRLYDSHPHLHKEIKYWLSKKGVINSHLIKNIDNSHVLTKEVCSKAGKLSWDKKSKEEKKHHMEKMRSNINHDKRISDMLSNPNFVGNQPWWNRYVEGQLERKRSFNAPEGHGWKPGKGDSYKRKRVRCTITGHEGTQSSLARWQKNRNIDPSNREFIGDFK